MRKTVFMDHGDQHVAEVPCERIPDGKLGAYVCHLEGTDLWHVVATEEESDGQIIGEVGKRGIAPPGDGLNSPLAPRHKYHVRVHDHKQPLMASRLGAPKP